MDTILKTKVHPSEGLCLCDEKRTKSGVRQRWFKANNPVPFDITWIAAQPAILSKGDIIDQRKP